jgi:hypothetical protein
MVISAGLGGLDAELDEGNFPPRPCFGVCRRRTDRCRPAFLGLFQRTLAWQKLAAVARARRPSPAGPALGSLLRSLLALAASQAAGKADASLRAAFSLELNPAGVRPGCDGARRAVRVRHAARRRLPRPIHKIDKLIHPKVASASSASRAAA